MLAESALRLLGVRFPVTDFKASVESAYRKLAVALHPDKGGSPDAFRLAKQARDVCVGDSEECLSWSETDEACKRLCADPRVVGVNASRWSDDGLACSYRNLAKAKSEIANLRVQAAMAGFQRQTQQRLDEEHERRLEAMARQRRLEEEHARRLAELRRLREAELQRQQRRQEEHKALERRLREAEVQRRREKDLERQARESLQAQQEEAARRDEEARGSEATEPEKRDFKHYVPRAWPALNPAQVKKKEACLKQLRSLRTMRKRGQDKRQEERVASCNRRIVVILREAWELHRKASGQ